MTYNYEMMIAAFKMLFSLILVVGILAALYYLMRYMSKRGHNITSRGLINVLANNYIGVKKNISLIEVPGSILILGITNDSISLLSKIEDKEAINTIKNNCNKTSGASFSDQLKKISLKFKSDVD